MCRSDSHPAQEERNSRSSTVLTENPQSRKIQGWWYGSEATLDFNWQARPWWWLNRFKMRKQIMEISVGLSHYGITSLISSPFLFIILRVVLKWMKLFSPEFEGPAQGGGWRLRCSQQSTWTEPSTPSPVSPLLACGVPAGQRWCTACSEPGRSPAGRGRRPCSRSA